MNNTTGTQKNKPNATKHGHWGRSPDLLPERYFFALIAGVSL